MTENPAHGEKGAFRSVAWHRGSFDEVAHGSVDLAFGSNLVEVPPPLQSQTIYEEGFVCVADRKRRLPKSLTLEQYLKLEHMSISILGGIQVSPDKTLAAMGYKRDIAIHVPYFEAAIWSVQGINLVAMIPSKFLPGIVHNPAIKILTPPLLTMRPEREAPRPSMPGVRRGDRRRDSAEERSRSLPCGRECCLPRGGALW